MRAARPAADGLTAILPVIFQRRAGVLVVLEAYFDESYRGDNPLRPLCVAGYAFEQGAYRQFSAEWTRHLSDGGPRPVAFVHMTELYSPHGATYKGWSVQERADFLSGAVALIRKHMLYGVAAQFSETLFKKLAPKFEGKYGGAYTGACQVCLQLAGRLLTRDGRTEQIAYVFESGHSLWREANAVLDVTGKDPALSQLYRYQSHTAMGKIDAHGLQAADVLAWIIGRYASPPPDNHTMRAFGPIIEGFTVGDSSRYLLLDFMTSKRVRRFIEHQERTPNYLLVDLQKPSTPKKGVQRKRG